VSALREMIGCQADVLRELAGTDLGPAPARLGAAPRIALVGTGTSFHAAELGAELLARGGRDVRAVESARFARADAPRRGRASEEAVILITHTGETAFALEVRHRQLAAGGGLVSITGPGPGWPEAIVTPVRERAETYTVSYTAALGVLGLIAHRLDATDTGPESLIRVADEIARIVADPRVAHVPMPARALALVGAGPWAVTAREAALKLREGARMLCEGFDAERLLHGAAVPYGPADGLVLLDPAADPDGLTAALGEAARSEGIPVSELHPDAPREDDPFLAQLPLTVRVQCLAARFAELRGTDPDTAITGAWAEPALWSLGAPAAE
jgi:glucosamine--fructose-6-phosphate aminotransferase (isomerizing)